MAARLIDGKAIAEQIHAETSAEIARLQSQHNLTPGLAVVLVGDNPASAAYVATKDVDGFHPLNVGKLALGNETGFVPCTPAGVHQLLIRSGVKLEGAHVVVLGRSRIVGRPVSLILSQKSVNATVTVAHSRTKNL